MSDILRSQDDQARRIAQAEFSRPVIMEAGAGTGKTATLVGRILNWALGKGWNLHATKHAAGDTGPLDEGRIASTILERIVAITFTDKAAAEMAERVASGLVAIYRRTPPVWFNLELVEGTPEEITHRAEHLLRHVDHLRVTTIHAFCRSILASNPLEAELHPDFDVDADGFRRERIVNQVIRGYAGGTAIPSDLEELFAFDIGLTEICSLLDQLLERGILPDDLPEDPYPEKDVKAVLEALLKAVGTILLLGEKPVLQGSGSLKNAIQTMDALQQFQRDVRPNSNATELREHLVDAFTGIPLARLGKWGEGEFSKTEAKAMGLHTGEIETASRQLKTILRSAMAWEPDGFRRLLRLMKRLLSEAHQRMTEEGCIQFPMLLRGTRDLLCTNPQLAALKRQQIDQLLIDEFQDTNPIQCDVVRCLALEGRQENRPGLFLVGDPKQSIYGWRQADLTAYRDFVLEVEKAGGLRQILRVNYRSVPAILEEVERVHDPLMSATPAVSAPFEKLLPSNENIEASGFIHGGRKPVEYWVSAEVDADGQANAKTTSANSRLMEGEAIARDLLELYNDGELLWKDAAIIMRSTTDVDDYLRPLREAGIPYAVEKDKNFYRRRETVDTICMLRVISDPHDLVALVAFLRAPWAGIPDAAIGPLWIHGLPRHLGNMEQPDWEQTLDTVIDSAFKDTADVPGLGHLRGWDTHLKFLLREVRKLRQLLLKGDRLEWMTAFKRAWAREVSESGLFLGAHRLANLDRLERKVAELLSQDDWSDGEIFNALKKGLLEDLDAEEGAPGDETVDAVKILTIHKSKGLTFKHVYLVNTNRKPKSGSGIPHCAVEQMNHFSVTALMGWPSALWHHYQERESGRELGESIRTLYVAMTRPQSRLVILGNHLSASAFKPRGASPLTHLLETRYRGEARMMSPVQMTAQDKMGARWYYPFLNTSPGPENRSFVQHKGSNPQMGRHHFSQLEAARQDAVARMKVPMFQTASTLGHEITPNPLLEPKPLSLAAYGSPVGAIVGTLIHRFFEHLKQGDTEHFDVLQESIVEWLSNEPDAVRKEVQDECERLLKDLKGSTTLEAFSSIQIEARELPLLMQVEGTDITTVSGSIDLLYRDESNQWVVADYKTDRIPATANGLPDLIEKYKAQGRTYVEAVQQALGLKQRPRFELWFLRLDKRITVEV